MVPYWQRVKYAFRTFFSILDHSRIPEDVAAGLGATAPTASTTQAVPPKPAAPGPEPPHRAVQMLALLQRDGRLVDFLMEDLSAYQDAQVGAAVRDVHAGCRQALTRYFTLEPVMADDEGQSVTVERDADAARIKVIGNITGQPPYRGVLRHRGWQASRIELPPVPASGRAVVAPAEVEIP
jgi:hypothetical protein